MTVVATHLLLMRNHYFIYPYAHKAWTTKSISSVLGSSVGEVRHSRSANSSEIFERRRGAASSCCNPESYERINGQEHCYLEHDHLLFLT